MHIYADFIAMATTRIKFYGNEGDFRYISRLFLRSVDNIWQTKNGKYSSKDHTRVKGKDEVEVRVGW